MTAAIILAAGDGKRMKSKNPKVCCEVLFKPMLSWVLDSCLKASVPAENTCVIILLMSNNREEKYKTHRLIQLDKWIRNGGYPSVQAIQDEYEISRRTVMRDLEFLRDRYDAPLEYDRTRNGYYYTDPTFMIQNVLLTEGDLFTVSTMMPLMEQYKNERVAILESRKHTAWYMTGLKGAANIRRMCGEISSKEDIKRIIEFALLENK